MTNDLAQPRIVSVGGHTPQIDPGAFVAAGATLVGDVHVKKGASAFYGRGSPDHDR